MLINIITALPIGKILSSSIPVIEAIATTSNAVEVWLAHDQGGLADTVFSTSIFPFDSRLSVYDLSRIIEEDMRSRGAINTVFQLHIGDVSVDLDVVYCDYIAQGFDLDNSFLSTLTTQRVYADSSVFVTKIGGSGTGLMISGVFVYGDDRAIADGDDVSYKTFSTAYPSGLGSGESLLCSFADWRSRFTDYGDSDPVRLLSATLRDGNRTKTLYFMPGSPDIRLCFRNCFNALEAVDLKGIVTEKTKVSQEVANLLGQNIAYNRRTEKEYEFASEGLTEHEARSIDQLLNANKVWVLVNGEPAPIIVTDHTCEIDNNNEAQPTVKFTWQFADRKPHLNPDAIAASLQIPGVFSDEFTYQFA